MAARKKSRFAAKKAPAPPPPKPPEELEGENDTSTTDGAVFVNNVTKEHCLAFPVDGGLVAVFPVSLVTDGAFRSTHTEIGANES